MGLFAITYLPVLIYFLLEFQRKTPISESTVNRGSNILIGSALVWMILIPTILHFYYVQEPEINLWYGLLIGLIGVWIRRAAILSLGRFYSRNVGIQGKHQLIQSGWYRIIRHPGYFGTLLTFLGFAISTGIWISVATTVVFFFIAYSYRIHLEEKTMIIQFGEEYAAYRKKTWRIIPFIY